MNTWHNNNLFPALFFHGNRCTLVHIIISLKPSFRQDFSLNLESQLKARQNGKHPIWQFRLLLFCPSWHRKIGCFSLCRALKLRLSLILHSFKLFAFCVFSMINCTKSTSAIFPPFLLLKVVYISAIRSKKSI